MAGTVPRSALIAALFLPPLGIFLTEGVTRNFWITFGLTCLGFFPGIAFSFYVLLNRHGRGVA